MAQNLEQGVPSQEVYKKPEEFTPDELLEALGKSQYNEIGLTFTRWPESPGGSHTPNLTADESLESALMQAYGIDGYEIKTYDDPENFPEPFWQALIKTQKEVTGPDGTKIPVFLSHTFYPEKGYGLSQLSIHRGEPKLITGRVKGGTEAKIDITARTMEANILAALGKKPEGKDIVANVDEVNRFNEEARPDLVETIRSLRDILLDADDCLLPTKGEPYDKEKFRAFAILTKALDTQGIKTYLNTGRGLEDVQKTISIIEQLGGEIQGSICENGSLFYDAKTGKVEIDPSISAEGRAVRDGIYDFLAETVVKPKLGAFERGKEVGISLNCLEEGNKKARAELNPEEAIKYKKKDIKFEELADIDVFGAWILKYLRQNEEKILEIAKQKAQEKGLTINPEEAQKILEAIISKITNSTTAVDVNPARFDGKDYVGVDKERGLESFCKLMGIPYDERDEDGKISGLLAIGDSSGDLPTAKHTATATPGNAKGLEQCKIVYKSPYEYTSGINDIYSRIINVLLELKKPQESA